MLTPKIIRTAEPGCCEWCSLRAGEESYPVKDHNIYRRHPNCRCQVEYYPGNRKRGSQNVWSKESEKSKIDSRKNILGVDMQPRVREIIYKETQYSPENVMPEYLRAATPGKGSITYEYGHKRSTHTPEIKTAQ